MGWTNRRRLLAVVTISAIATGCGRSPHQIVPVTGKITIDGQPFADGKVMFAPVAAGDSLVAGKAAFGLLQPDGTFQLSTERENDGALVGDHAVTIIRLSSEDLGRPSAGGEFPPFERITLPSGRLKVTAGDENHFDIALTSADIKKFARQR